MYTNLDVNSFSVYEPRTEINNERSFVIVKGGQTITYTPYPATSYSNSNFNFTTNPPGKNIILDRVIEILVPVTITFTGGGGDAPSRMIQRGRDAFRAFPFQSVVTSFTCAINGFNVSIEINDIIHPLSRFHNCLDNRNTFGSIMPQMLDNYQNYTDADLANNNPLAFYADNPAETPRGAYPFTVNPNTNTNATVTGVIREYLVLPPFIFDGKEAGGLVNLDTLTFSFNLSPNLQRIWSRSTSNLVPISSMVVNFGQPTLLLGWITPRLTQPIPPVMTYPYFQISKYIANQPNGTINSNASAEMVSQVIQFDSIPRKIYAYAKQSNQVINSSLANTLNTPDTYLKIDRVNISWNNIDGVLSGANPVNLYEFSTQNGLNMPFVQWNALTQDVGVITTDTPRNIGLTGGIICIELGKDLGLYDNQAEGMLSKINFQLKLTVTNVNQTVNLIPDLYVIAVYDGILQIGNNQAIGRIGVIDSNGILNAPVNHDVSYRELEKIYGGNFFSKFKDVAGKVFKGLKDSKAISGILGAIPSPQTQVASQIARSLGLGARAGGGARAGKRRGGVLFGGSGCEDCGGEEEDDEFYGGKLTNDKEMLRRIKNVNFN